MEGHGGIFEVAIEGTMLYTNRSACGAIPTNEVVLQIIEGFTRTGQVAEKEQPNRGGT